MYKLTVVFQNCMTLSDENMETTIKSSRIHKYSDLTKHVGMAELVHTYIFIFVVYSRYKQVIR